MSQSLDIPVSKNYTTIIFGSLLFILLSYTLGYVFYARYSKEAYVINSIVCSFAALTSLASLVFVHINKFEDRLPNYLALTASFAVATSSLFVFTGLFLSVISSPISTISATALGCFTLIYIASSVFRSARMASKHLEVGHSKKPLFIIKNEKLIVIKSRLDTLDSSMNKYPFKFIEAASFLFPAISIVGLAILGGLYNQTAYPGLTVRFFFAGISFLVSPLLISMMVYGIYVNYIFPKKVYGSGWKNIWRETE